MNIYAKVVNGVVTDARDFPPGETGPEGYIPAPDYVSIGVLHDGTDFADRLVYVGELRVVRDELLASSDFTQLADAPYTVAEKALWVTYRQSLRDLPDGYTPVADPTYPTKPS